MPESITIEGSLQGLHTRLIKLRDLIMYRKAVGWPILQGDEEWLYESMGDNRVCPVCQAFHQQTFRGDEVRTRFPGYDMLLPTIIAPNPHEHYALTDAPCRCTLTMQHPAETMEARLHGEKELAVS